MKNLAKRELDVLRILWKNDHSLLASEIASLDTQGSIHSIQTVLNVILFSSITILPFNYIIERNKVLYP